jgi:hypothetical protein
VDGAAKLHGWYGMSLSAFMLSMVFFRLVCFMLYLAPYTPTSFFVIKCGHVHLGFHLVGAWRASAPSSSACSLMLCAGSQYMT